MVVVVVVVLVVVVEDRNSRPGADRAPRPPNLPQGHALQSIQHARFWSGKWVGLEASNQSICSSRPTHFPSWEGTRFSLPKRTEGEPSFDCLSVCLSVSLSVCLSVWLAGCLSVGQKWEGNPV